MSYDDVQFDVGKSLIKMCNDFIVSNSLTDFQVFDFDAHASLNELPETNLIGIAEYSLTELGGYYSGSCMVIVSTKQSDSDLTVLRPVVSKMFNRVKSDSVITVVEGDTGSVLGNLKVMAGTEAMAVARTKSRPLQAMNISFGLSLSEVPSP